MMISPEAYRKNYLEGKTPDEIMSVIGGLEQEIKRLKDISKSQNCKEEAEIFPSAQVRLSCTKQYLAEAKAAYAQAKERCAHMSKPYTVCYMMTSVDGRVDCAMTSRLQGVEEYYPTLDELCLKSAVSGRVTAELEIAEKGKYEPKDLTAVGGELYSKKCDSVDGYDIILDTNGTLLWKPAKEYDKPLIIVTSERVTAEYLTYLDGLGISYIAVGEDKIDLTRAAELLKNEFAVDRMGVVGGPTINTAFLDAGLLDEVILLIGAGIDGRASFPPVFNSGNEDRELIPLKLVEAKTYPSGAVLIRYKTAEAV